MNGATPLTPDQKRRVQELVQAGEMALDVIARRFGRSRKTLVQMIRDNGWSNPWMARQAEARNIASRLRVKAKTQKRNAYVANPAKYIADKRAEVHEIEHKLYGSLYDDVQWLRRRGWIVNAERAGYRVGNVIVDAATLAEKAARERRLAGVA